MPESTGTPALSRHSTPYVQGGAQTRSPHREQEPTDSLLAGPGLSRLQHPGEVVLRGWAFNSAASNGTFHFEMPAGSGDESKDQVPGTPCRAQVRLTVRKFLEGFPFNGAKGPEIRVAAQPRPESESPSQDGLDSTWHRPAI